VSAQAIREKKTMISVREAAGRDVAAIREIFLASYGTDYTDPRYYDESLLTRLLYSDDSLLLVAEDSDTGRVIGTASVDLEVGAHSDLVGEFCRLAVHPAFRHRGVATLLMSERLRRVQDRLQVGLVEARVAHPYSLKIVEAHQFAVVGFFPSRWRLRELESLALLARYFGNALELRKNHPRIIPEVYPLAHLALENCSLPADVIVDEDAPAYPPSESYQVQELTTEGYAPLLRIERGRVRHREIFGPVRLHYGVFKLQARRSRYLIAREHGRLAGAIGFTVDPLDNTVRIFELIALHDDVVRFMLEELSRSEGRAHRDDEGVRFLSPLAPVPSPLIEVDVSAHAPRMQRTLLEMGFVPVAYVPALVFHDVERLDVVKMMRLPAPPDVRTDGLSPRCKAVADVIVHRFQSRSALPRVAQAVQRLSLFAGLNAEQVARLAGVCGVATFKAGEVVFQEGEVDNQMYVLLQGEAAITLATVSASVGRVRSGECLGEISLLAGGAHSATATAVSDIETAVLTRQDLAELLRLRPDIGLHIYRNLALGMGDKLRRLNAAVAPAAKNGFILTVT
jgi:ribosomal protein S18 acetylase RimI-like enzyme